MTHRPLLTLQLSSSLKSKIAKSGYTTVDEYDEISELDRDLQLSQAQYQELMSQLRPKSTIQTTAGERWAIEKEARPITTSSTALNSLFPGGKGIPLRKVTDISGLSGTGKTQLGYPSHTAALEEQQYSEGSVVARRAMQMSTEVAMAVGKACEFFMSGIQYFRVHSPVELLALVRILERFLTENNNVKLIVVDSISFLFRSNLSPFNTRAKLIMMIGKQLTALATAFNVAVVVMNQMTTKIESNPDTRLDRDADPRIQPAMGDAWAAVCTNRIRLNNNHGQRTATVFKSPISAEITVPFQITTTGFKDVEGATEVNNTPPQSDEQEVFFWDSGSKTAKAGQH
ncbi:DNA repair protein rad51c [Podila epigama]|nr:DNA repair protein rad51c [Podila epigama]